MKHVHYFSYSKYFFKALRHHLGWFILLIFALEGITGLAPAIYMDGKEGYLHFVEV